MKVGCPDKFPVISGIFLEGLCMTKKLRTFRVPVGTETTPLQRPTEITAANLPVRPVISVFLCAGVGVMMLLALTVERYVSVCHPGRNQPFMGPPRLIVSLIPLLTFLLYLPNVFRYELQPCLPSSDGPISYQRQDNRRFLNSVFYSMYKVRGKLSNTVVDS